MMMMVVMMMIMMMMMMMTIDGWIDDEWMKLSLFKFAFSVMFSNALNVR